MKRTPRLPHEFHAVGNISGCKHCRRMDFLLRASDECPVRLRKRVVELERLLARTPTPDPSAPLDTP